MAQGMEKGGGSGAGGFATEMAVGMAMAQQMMQQTGMSGTTAPAATPCAGATVAAPAPSPANAGIPELMSPAEVAKVLGVTETDVMSILSSGELKGKKIGVTRFGSATDFALLYAEQRGAAAFRHCHHDLIKQPGSTAYHVLMPARKGIKGAGINDSNHFHKSCTFCSN